MDISDLLIMSCMFLQQQAQIVVDVSVSFLFSSVYGVADDVPYKLSLALVASVFE